MNQRQSMSQCRSIGVDVSKRQLDITGYDGTSTCHVVIDNEITAINRWLAGLEGYEGLIICESTGWYHYLFAHLCFMKDLDIRVINPLLSSKHSKSAIRKVKSDPADSGNLAVMGVTEPRLPARPNLSQSRIKLRKKQGLLHSWEKQIQAMKARMKDYEDCSDTLGDSLSEIEVLMCDEVKRMEQLKRGLEKELEQLALEIARDEEVANQEILATLPGYSNVVSALLSVVLDPAAKSAKSWVGFVGIDISVRESGTWTGKTRLTKRGNPYLRKRLFQAAWGACLNYPEVRAYYDQLKAQGRMHTEAVVMVARKLLRIAYTLVQKQTKYDPAVAFGA